MTDSSISRYLSAYPEHIQQQAEQLLAQNRIKSYLLSRYPQAHSISSDNQLRDYVQAIKKQYMRQSDPLKQIRYDDKVMAERDALGVHIRSSKNHGGRLRASKEIRIDSRFRRMPEAFLRMLCVHELAHLHEMDHNKAFYNLCAHMEPDYFQLELDLRLYLAHCDQYEPFY